MLRITLTLCLLSFFVSAATAQDAPAKKDEGAKTNKQLKKENAEEKSGGNKKKTGSKEGKKKTQQRMHQGDQPLVKKQSKEHLQALKWRARKMLTEKEASVPDYKWDAYQRDVPEWYQDAKFGIYAHWGPYNLGMETANFTGSNNSWYAKYMHVKGHPYNKQHNKLFGPLKKTGYTDYFKKFSVPKFDPAEWADAVASSGARFAGPVAMHHDGFAMWASKLHPWNAKNSAAGRDLAGELIREYRRRGLKIVSSFHHAQNVTGVYYGGRPGSMHDLPVDFDSQLSDPRLARLYGRWPTQAAAEEYWLDILKEFVTTYEPDQLWLDGGLRFMSDRALYRMTKFYYDYCDERGIEGVISQKRDQVPRRVTIFDYERGGAPEILPRTWQTDDSPGPWMYINSAVFKGADWTIPLLVDIVSKNGVLLLNIAPLADGSIHPEQRQMLRQVGEWLNVHGEAVYGSRPWKVHYQGDEPHFYAGGKEFAKTYAEYGRDDFRFTRSKDGRTLYVFAMGPDPLGDITIETLTTAELSPESSASLIGSSRVVPLKADFDGHVVLPAGELMKDAPRRGKGPRVFRIYGLK